jgi:hypothetical protein
MLTLLLLTLAVLGTTFLVALTLLPALLLERVLGRGPVVDEVDEDVGDPWAIPLVNPARPFLESMG